LNEKVESILNRYQITFTTSS